MRLAALYQRALRRDQARHRRASQSGLSDLQFTAAYRVPFQYSRFVRRHLKAGVVRAVVVGRDGDRSRRQRASRPDRLVRRQRLRLRLLQGVHRARQRARARSRPGARHLPPRRRDNVERLRAISGLDEVSFHMSGTEAVMQAVRLARYHTRRSHLVRFCGAYHGWWDDVQPGVGNPRRRARPTRSRTWTRTRCACCARASDIACVLVNPLQALHPNANAPSDSTLVDSDRGGALRSRRLHATGCSSCARSAPSAASC